MKEVKKMKAITFGLIVLAGIALFSASCRKKGCTDNTAYNYNLEAKKDNSTCVYRNSARIRFTHSFNDEDVTSADFSDLKFMNEKGHKLSIERLRYSISDVRLYQANGDSVLVDMYHLIDLADATTLTYTLAEKFDPIVYTGIGFNFGFTPEDNISNGYPDLNLASWNWQTQLGGGYHQLQMDGKFIDSNGEEKGFNFHNGSATKAASSSEPAMPNYIFVKLEKTIPIDTDKGIIINMQIDEWFKNPILWDLDLWNTQLMGNPSAQLIMSSNGKSVFEIGAIKKEIIF